MAALPEKAQRCYAPGFRRSKLETMNYSERSEQTERVNKRYRLMQARQREKRDLLVAANAAEKRGAKEEAQMLRRRAAAIDVVPASWNASQRWKVPLPHTSGSCA
jgi:hypothetical protein